MIFHHLRMLSFSKSLLSLKSLSKTKSKSNDKECFENTTDVVEVSMPTHVSQAAEHATDLKENTLDSPIDRMKVRPRLERESKSETFKIPIKRKKKRTNRKTLSLHDIKKRLSLKDLNPNRIRQKFQTLKKENISNRNQNIAKKHEINVLYTAESKHRNKKRHMHLRKLSKPYSSSDIFGFYRRNRLYGPHTFYHRYNKDDNPFNKLRARAARKRKKLHEAHSNCPYTHYSLKVVISSNESRQKSETNYCTNPLHYNLLKFPQNSKIKMHQKTSVRQDCRKNWANKNVGCYCTVHDKHQTESLNLKVPVLCVDMGVSACGSEKQSRKIKTPPNGINNTCPSNELRECIRSSLKPFNRRRKSKHSLRKCSFSQLYHKIHNKLLKFSTVVHSKYRTQNSSTRNVVKYVFLALIVLAWSPCIIGIGIGWFLSAPLRPQHVINANTGRKYKCSDDCFYNQSQYDFWTKYIVIIRRLSKATRNVFFAIFTPKKDLDCEPQDLPRCRSHPDPRTRYTLYHADGRGWVIKPARSEPVLPKQNRFKQVFQNLFCDCSHPEIVQNSYKGKINSKKNRSNALNKCVCTEKRSINASSLRTTNNTTLSKCGSPRKQRNQRHGERVSFFYPKSQKLEETYKSRELNLERLTLTQQESPEEQKSEQPDKKNSAPLNNQHHIGKEMVQQKLDDRNRHTNIDNVLKKSQIVDQIQHTCRGHLSERALSKQLLEDSSKPRVCSKSACGVHLSEKNSKSLVGSKSVCKAHLSEKTSKPSVQLQGDKSQVEVKRIRKSGNKPGPELAQPNSVRGRSKRSSIKPDRITEHGPLRKSAKSQKIININISNNKNTQTQRRGYAMPKGNKERKTLPSKNTCKCKWRDNFIIGRLTKMLPKKQKLPFCKRVRNWFSCLGGKTVDSVGKFDNDLYDAIYPVKVGCADAYLNTLRRRPCFWIYGFCPRKYPAFLKWYYCNKNCCYYCMFCISVCFWAPIAMSCYICYRLCCSCCCSL